MSIGVERGKGEFTVERICFRRGDCEARITRFPLNWFRTGISRGKRPRGTGFPAVGGGPVRFGRSPCCTVVSS